MSEEAELIEISGRISSVIYANEENGYTVLRLDTLDGGLTTVVGTLPSAYPGEPRPPVQGRIRRPQPAPHGGGDLRLSLRPRGEGRRPRDRGADS